VITAQRCSIHPSWNQGQWELLQPLAFESSSIFDLQTRAAVAAYSNDARRHAQRRRARLPFYTDARLIRD
jgi:hypothetical protein